MSQQKQTVFNYNNEEIGGCLMLMYDSDDELEKFNLHELQQQLQNYKPQLNKTSQSLVQIQQQSKK